ncbi:hypothetical protein [Kribbella sp. NBC_00359]|uniref:hypothetical protein n=1 Tax=Kribbella sp. NBC_00359 TaxID=2975966 RepID=UPI002E21C0CE
MTAFEPITRMRSWASMGRLIFLFGATAAPINLLPDVWRRIAQASPLYGVHGLPAEIAAGTRSDGPLAGAR